MRIGLDFDNTIVCYDQAIALLAEELFELPPDLPRTKLGVRNYLRATSREPEWTAFQGELYGPGMHHAQPFEGAISTMQQLVAAGHELVIISHRTRQPYAGEPHDLHLAARNWVADRLQSAGLFGEAGDKTFAHFLESREQKIQVIANLGCSLFLDDLTDVLNDSSFPLSTRGILFSPGSGKVNDADKIVVKNWNQFKNVISRLS